MDKKFNIKEWKDTQLTEAPQGVDIDRALSKIYTILTNDPIRQDRAGALKLCTPIEKVLKKL